jgi:hypothetical protein
LQLPNAERAVIAPDKSRSYLLVPGHQSGGKARFFAALGYTGDNWADFERALREQHLILDAEEVESTEWGTMYAIIGPISGPSEEQAEVRSVWIIRTGEDTPRFVTAYPAR